MRTASHGTRAAKARVVVVVRQPRHRARRRPPRRDATLSNPRTLAQQRQRGLLTNSAGAWRSLHPVQRTAWGRFAKTTGLASSGFHAHNSVRLVMNAAGQTFSGDPPPRAGFEDFSLGELEAKIVGETLHLALPDVKDKTKNTGYKIEFTRPGSPGRSNWDPLFTVIKYARSIEELRDPVALGAVYVKRFHLPPAGMALACRITQVMHGQLGNDDSCMATVTRADPVNARH